MAIATQTMTDEQRKSVALEYLNLDLSRVWRGWPLVDGAQDFDHGFLFGG